MCAVVWQELLKLLAARQCVLYPELLQVFARVLKVSSESEGAIQFSFRELYHIISYYNPNMVDGPQTLLRVV